MIDEMGSGLDNQGPLRGLDERGGTKQSREKGNQFELSASWTDASCN